LKGAGARCGVLQVVPAPEEKKGREMITTEEIYAWVHKIIDGPGGLHDFEYYEMAVPNIPRDEAIAVWTLRALANPESEEAGKIVALIQEHRNQREWKLAMMEKPAVGERVLALYKGCEASVVYWGSDDKWHEWDGDEIDHITHWMPLPPLPGHEGKK
jgi:hypothetical protein